MTALDRQVGGSHYKDYVIQPYVFFLANQIPHHKAAIIRRILRYDHPTGKGVEDLDKIIHEIELIKELDSNLKVKEFRNEKESGSVILGERYVDCGLCDCPANAKSAAGSDYHGPVNGPGEG